MDSHSFVASDRRSVIEAYHRTYGRRESRQIRQIVAIAVHRLLISGVEGNRKGCDPAYVYGHP